MSGKDPVVNSKDTGQSASGTENKKGDQKPGACAASCGVNQAYVEKGEAGGTGSTQVNANHIIQYPRQPKMDDGKWISVGSLIGALLGKFADRGTLNKAKDAESKWKDLNNQLHERGLDLWNKAPKEWDKATAAGAAIDSHHDWTLGQRDAELARAQQLDNCNDDLHRKLCEFAQCGYQPDYDGIKARIMADVAAQTKKAREQACRSLNRYSAKQCCGIETALATTAVATSVGALYKAREDERARAWQINEGLVFKAVEITEKHRDARMASAQNLDKAGVVMQQELMRLHTANYFDMLKLGGEFLSSAGKNYAWLADSYRKTADKMSKDLALLGALIATVLGMFLGESSGENECGGGGDKKKAPATTPPATGA